MQDTSRKFDGFRWLALLLLLIGEIGTAAIGQAEECKLPTGIKSDNMTCYPLAAKIIAVVETKDADIDEDIYVLNRSTGEAAEESCQNYKAGNQLVATVPDSNSRKAVLEFDCLYKNLIMTTDAASAPGTGHFYLFDLESEKLIFSDSAQKWKFENGKLLYFGNGRTIKEKDCPEGKTVGFGCREINKVSLDLKTFKKTPTREKEIIPIQ